MLRQPQQLPSCACQLRACSWRREPYRDRMFGTGSTSLSPTRWGSAGTLKCHVAVCSRDVHRDGHRGAGLRGAPDKSVALRPRCRHDRWHVSPARRHRPAVPGPMRTGSKFRSVGSSWIVGHPSPNRSWSDPAQAQEPPRALPPHRSSSPGHAPNRLKCPSPSRRRPRHHCSNEPSEPPPPARAGSLPALR